MSHRAQHTEPAPARDAGSSPVAAAPAAPFGLYVHIPYCRSRCRYCDFYSSVGDGVPEEYVSALLAAFPRFAPRDAAGRPLRPATLYLGGGTPSLLAPGQVESLIAAFDPQPGAEVTLEANPGGGAENRLTGYRAAGVNRLSLGVQTAREESLRLLGRPHTARDAARTLAAAEKAGFDSVSGDIMLALPGYTAAEFDDTLALLAAGGAGHVSAYLLKLEPGTPLAGDPPPGLPGPDETAEHYLHACEALEAAGYTQYEISNFARPGHESRHNLLYWECGDWLGLGPGAHSCLGGRRFSFAPDTPSFIKGPLPREEGALDRDDYIMLRLRLAAGLSEDALRARFGAGLSPRQGALLADLEKAGLARATPAGWALTRRGMLVQNSVLARLLE